MISFSPENKDLLLLPVTRAIKIPDCLLPNQRLRQWEAGLQYFWKVVRQAYLVLLQFTLLCFTEVFFVSFCFVLQIEGKTLHLQKDYDLLYCGGLEWICNIFEVCLYFHFLFPINEVLWQPNSKFRSLLRYFLYYGLWTPISVSLNSKIYWKSLSESQLPPSELATQKETQAQMLNLFTELHSSFRSWLYNFWQ